MTDQNEIPTQNSDELEDVEAHGLREVAAAAGIGAAVLGAGGAAIAATGASHVGPTPVMPRVPSVAPATHVDNPLVNAATGFVGDELAPASQFAGAVTSYTTDTVKPVTTTATNTVGTTESIAVKTVGTVDNTVNKELSGVLTPTEIFVTSTEGNALKLGGAALDAAGGTAALALNTADKAVGIAADTVGGTAAAAVQFVTLHLQVTAGSDATHPSGTITVTNLAGHTIAQANVDNGVATVRVDPTQAANINFHPNTQKLMPSTLQWSPRL